MQTQEYRIINMEIYSVLDLMYFLVDGVLESRMQLYKIMLSV